MSLSNLPTITLGDFNEDSYNNTHSILNIVNSSNFKQIVQSPTSDRGTLIDHMYYNRPVSDVVVHDTYDSDHDTVYGSIVVT